MLESPKKFVKECFQQCNKPRHFHLIPDRTVGHDNIPDIESILGTKNFFKFSVCGDKEKIISRRLSCFCNTCVDINYDVCTNKEVVGEVKKHNLVNNAAGRKRNS